MEVRLRVARDEDSSTSSCKTLPVKCMEYSRTCESASYNHIFGVNASQPANEFHQLVAYFQSIYITPGNTSRCALTGAMDLYRSAVIGKKCLEGYITACEWRDKELATGAVGAQ